MPRWARRPTLTFLILSASGSPTDVQPTEIKTGFYGGSRHTRNEALLRSFLATPTVHLLTRGREATLITRNRHFAAIPQLLSQGDTVRH
jgi:hypothetical protein